MCDERDHFIGIAFCQHRLGGLLLRGDPSANFPASPQEALKYLKLAAESGYEVMYSSGLGSVLSSVQHPSFLPEELQDDATAVKWLTIAANKNDLQSQLILAHHLYDGLGVKHDIRAAVALWRKAFDSGSPKAAYHLGKLHYHGTHPHIIPTNKQEGIRLMTIAAEGEKGYDAKLELALHYSRAGAPAQAEKWHLAAQGSALGKFALATFYCGQRDYIPRGMTQKQADLKVVQLFTDAATEGYHHAKLALGMLHFRGFRSIPADGIKALPPLLSCLNEPNLTTEPSRAALDAVFYLATYAKDERFVKVLKGSALGFATPLEWYTFGAKHGHKECQYEIAKAYYEGSDGLKQDYALASHWLHQCLKQGHHQRGVELLGKMQHRGVFVRPPESDEEDE